MKILEFNNGSVVKTINSNEVTRSNRASIVHLVGKNGEIYTINTNKIKKQIIILNGEATCGKNTFVEFCKKYFEYIYHISTITPIKNALKEMFVDINNKDEKTRKLMSDIKDIMIEYNNCSKQYVQLKIKDLDSFLHSYILFVDSREPEEIEWFVKNINAKSLLIRNKNIKQKFTNHADSNVENFDYDYYIDNSESLDELDKKAKKFIEEIIK